MRQYIWSVEILYWSFRLYNYLKAPRWSIDNLFNYLKVP